MEKRKDKPVRSTFGDGFEWSQAIDAAADVYNGVGCLKPYFLLDATLIVLVRFLDCLYGSSSPRMV
jgi:hypothetical protein